jgi:glycosyltransferase 2 family protein
VYGFAVLSSDFDQIQESLGKIGWVGWLAIFSLSTLNIFLRFSRWQYYLKTLDYQVEIRRNLQYFVAGFAFTSTPAKAGEAVRSLYLKNREDVNYSASLGALFVERLTDLTAVVLLAMAAVYSFEEYRGLVIIAGCLILGFLPLIHSELLRTLLTRLGEKSKSARLSAAFGHLVQLIISSAALLRSLPLYGGMALGIIAALAVSLIMYLVLGLLGAEISLALAIGIYAIGILAGVLSFLPGGIGSVELVMIGLLMLAGVDQTTATTATLVCRIATLWYPIALGVLAVIRLEFMPGTTGEGVQT